jgi:hypothetical protein
VLGNRCLRRGASGAQGCDRPSAQRRAPHQWDRRGSDLSIRIPVRVLRPRSAPRLLTSTQHKLQLIRGLGVEHLLIIHFDQEFASTAPEQFIRGLAAASKPLHEICVGINGRLAKDEPAIWNSSIVSGTSSASKKSVCQRWRSMARS